MDIQLKDLLYQKNRWLLKPRILRIFVIFIVCFSKVSGASNFQENLEMPVCQKNRVPRVFQNSQYLHSSFVLKGVLALVVQTNALSRLALIPARHVAKSIIDFSDSKISQKKSNIDSSRAVKIVLLASSAFVLGLEAPSAYFGHPMLLNYLNSFLGAYLFYRSLKSQPRLT